MPKKLFMKKWFVLFVALCMIATTRFPSPASAAGTTYYVDSINGDDANSGTDTSAAWNSLAKINATVFNPGDTILFKTGGVWNGQLSPKGSGVNGSPIVIDMYGTGSKPVINGGGLNNTGTVYLVNQEYWEINHLEVTNDDNLSANDTADVRMGIYYKIDANLSGNNHVFSHIYIRNCYIHDVDGNENGSAASAGISGEIVGPSTASSARFDDIRIENNTLTKVDRTAIQPNKLNIFTCPGTDTCFRDGVRNNNQWGTGFHVANNTMNDIGGDGILMRETKDAIVEHNVLSSFGTRALTTTAVAGIWLWNANHTIFQFNEVYGGPASNQDGCAFDFDYYGIDTVYQYNYSHDNPMGTVLLMGANENDIFRYNISQNDGLAFRHFAYNETTSAYLYNNIFYYDGANHKINGDSKDETKLGYHFYNNIFYNKNTTTPTKWGNGNWDQLTFSHNIFYEASGQHTQQEPFDPYGMTGDPKFVNPGSGSIGLNTLQGYQLQTDSPAIDAGIESPQAQGIKDFYGNMINSSKPDIGVQELTGTPSAANSTMRYVPQQQMSDVATSSSTDHSSMSAVDGQDQTYWQSEDGSNPSLTIALGGTYNIDRVIYVPSTDDAAGVITNYQVYTSTDGVAFTKVATGTWANNTYRKRAVFPYVSASYIKIIAVHSSGHTSAAEVQVGIGTGTNGTGLYTKISQSSMTATASSIYSSSYAAALAIDGSTSTYWYPSSLPTAASPQYIILTMNQKYTISKFDYKPYSGAYAVTAYKLYVSTDGVNFTAIPTGTGNPGTWAADSSTKVATFDPVEVKAFKFEMTATGGSRPAVLELNLYSPDNSVPVPAQPTHLTASPVDSQVNLMWSTVTDATYYNVKRSSTSGGPYTTIAANVTGATYSDTGLANGTTYYYVVTAANSGGESSNSKEVNATQVQAPSLTATAGNAQVSLTWSTVTGATYYNVKRSTNSSGPYTTIASNVTATLYTNIGLTNGITYYYIVTAANNGGESVNSSAASAIPAAPITPVQAPTAPTSLTATANNAQVSLTWSTVTGATYYNVKRSTNSGGPYTTIATNVIGATYSDAGLVNGTTYYYVVTAANTGGESASSNVVSAIPAEPLTPVQAPTAPTSLTATAGNAQVSLTWSTVTGATYYNVKRSTSSGGPYTTIASNVTTTLYMDTGLTNGITYYYVMTAANAGGESTNSTEAGATPFPSSSNISQTTAPAGQSVEPTKDGVQIINVQPVSDKTADGKSVAKVTIEGATLAQVMELLKASTGTEDQRIKIEVKGSEAVGKVELPAASLAELLSKVPAAVLSLKNNGATYDLPLKVVDLSSFATTLGSTMKDVKVSITIEKVSGTTSVDIETKAKQAGLKPLTSAIDFSVTAEANGKQVSLNDFGKTYVSRTIEITKEVDAKKTTVVLYNPVTGTMSFVPATFSTSDGMTKASIKRPGNSIYTVVESAKTFEDLKGHWSKADVELLASKLVINGMTENSFAPQNEITRAQFAALLVRALGLSETNAAQFTDVKTNDWFAGAIGAASKVGLVDGFENGTFQPDANITREQMAVMITRAMNFGGKKAAADVKGLAGFTDAGSISEWAKEAVTQSVNAGIINGVTNQTFVPIVNASRAEAAVMLKRLLQYEQFIN